MLCFFGVLLFAVDRWREWAALLRRTRPVSRPATIRILAGLRPQ
jgi:hypothetical protein